MTALEWVGQAAAAPLAPARIVSLATALEVLVLGEHESLGKRWKLSRRVARIASGLGFGPSRRRIGSRALVTIGPVSVRGV